MNQIKASQEDVTSVRNMMIFFVLTPFFSTFAAVMCDFLNRDVRFLGVSLADRLDSVVQKFSRIVYFLKSNLLNVSALWLRIDKAGICPGMR